MMKDAIAKVVKQSLTDLNEDFGFLPKGAALESGLVLFGESGCLSSITLVSLVSDIEEKVAQELDKDIVLANEKTMSLRNSPFKTIDTLINYVHALVTEEAVHV